MRNVALAIGEGFVVIGMFLFTWADEGFRSAVKEMRLYFEHK